jgi:2-phosphosulfolactate phosphatase
MAKLSVHLLPGLTTPEELTGGAAVVIDVLRATTVMVTALAAGARAVIPTLEVDEAKKIAAGLPAGSVLLGGERGGLLIDGFDLANSPGEYTRERVAGKTIVFTTTNGTRALHACGEASRVLVGAFVNLTALCDVLRAETKPIHLLCAGTQQRITREDALFAGAVAAKLTAEARPELNDEATLVAAAWRDLMRQQDDRPRDDDGTAVTSLLRALQSSRGGRNALALGLDADLEAAARIDACPVVPQLDRPRGEIRLA